MNCRAEQRGARSSEKRSDDAMRHCTGCRCSTAQRLRARAKSQPVHLSPPVRFSAADTNRRPAPDRGDREPTAAAQNERSAAGLCGRPLRLRSDRATVGERDKIDGGWVTDCDCATAATEWITVALRSALGRERTKGSGGGTAEHSAAGWGETARTGSHPLCRCRAELHRPQLRT